MDITNIANLPNPEAAILETKKIAMEGINSAECVETIEKALRGKPGVKEFQVDQKSAIVSVTFDTRETNFPEIHDAILKSGYRPTRSLAE